VQPEGLDKFKKMSSGIEPATFRNILVQIANKMGLQKEIDTTPLSTPKMSLR
jgi:hypothetical protein